MATSLRESRMEPSADRQRHGSATQDGSPWTPTPSPVTQDNGHAKMGGEMESLARVLGWFSLGLGMAQIAAPSRVAQLIGVQDDTETIALMRVVGVRELASGLGLLTQPHPTPWLWARVGGDAMDLALLRAALGSPHADRQRVGAATVAVLGITAADVLASTLLSAEPNGASQPQATAQSSEVHATAAVTIQAPLAEVFAVWEGFHQLPRFMGSFASVVVSDERRSRWSLTAPAGITLEWDVEIAEVIPNQRIAWQSAEGTALNAAGEVRFRTAPGGRGTEVVFDARFTPPGGELGRKIAGIFAEALGTKIGNDLRRCKQLIELGEIIHSDDSVIPGPNPAQPPAAVPPGITASASAA